MQDKQNTLKQQKIHCLCRKCVWADMTEKKPKNVDSVKKTLALNAVTVIKFGSL